MLGKLLFPLLVWELDVASIKGNSKEMFPIIDKPIIQYIVEEINFAGFEEIIFVTHSSKNSIQNHLIRALN